MTAQPGASSEALGARWHETPRQLAAALRLALGAPGPPPVRRVFTFALRPGVLGGFYAASFFDGARTVHRCVFAYSQLQRLQWEVRPLEETLSAFRIFSVDGRLEIGHNTGDLLEYFLPSVEDSDPPAAAEAKRLDSYRAWLRASREDAFHAVSIRVLRAPQGGSVLCCTSGRVHLLIRADPEAYRDLEPTLAALGADNAPEIVAESPLYRDIMGEWKAP